ncbi:MAG: hypothetical protein AB1457_13470 [Chloroflexota bacterium]|nr:MAG: hypothetical protein KatS3mg045_0457 [Bellilinea sp.]
MKFRVLSESEYRMFRRIHSGDDVLAVEEAKIRREKAIYLNLRRQGKARLKEQLRRMQRMPGGEEWLEEEAEEVEQRAVRVYRNARRHKRRLRGLQPHEED